MRLYVLSVITYLCFGHLVRGDDEVKDWLEFYYEEPKPAEFMAQMKLWERDGLLRDFQVQPTLIAFTSQVLRQNRDKIQPWWINLKAMAPEDRAVFNTALMFARVSEADAIIKESLGEHYEEFEAPSKILEIKLDKTATVNMLWGYFYATGSKTAIRRIVNCFLFEDAPDDPGGVDIPEGYQPYYLELPRMAYVSILANLDRHPALLAICEEMLETDKTLKNLEKTNLYDLLSEIKPDKYPVRKKTKE